MTSRYYSGLYCISCLTIMTEDTHGNFRCGKCQVRVGVLR